MKRLLWPHAAALLLILLLAGCSKGGGSKPSTPLNPSCQLSATALNFSGVAVGDSATRTLTIRNAGGGTLAGTVSTGCGAFAVLGTRDYSLGAGQSQAFTIRFKPTSVAASSCALTTGTPCGNVALSGNGQAPTYEVFLNDVDLGRRGPNDRGGFAILNNGSTTLSGTVTSNCPNFVLIDQGLDVTSVPYVIPPGDVFNTSVSFRPTVGGPQSCDVQTGLPGYPTVRFTGYGQLCDVPIQYLDLGNVWESIDRPFTVSNPDSFAISGSFRGCGPFLVQPTSYTLGSGQTQTFTARFSAQGFSSGTVSCAQSIGQPTCAPVTLAAQDELLSPALTGCAAVTQGVIDFGTLAPGQVGNRTLTVKCYAERLGGGSIRCAGSLIELAPSLSFDSGAFSNLAVGDSMRINATFSSSDPGVHHCRVMVTTNDYAEGRVASYVECRATVLPALRAMRRAAYR